MGYKLIFMSDIEEIMWIKLFWCGRRCGGAGNLRDDIFNYKQQVDSCASSDEERRYILLDSGINALRRYFYLIAFRSYLYSRMALQGSTFAGEAAFAAWMQARPELGHLCDNLKLK
jgi:hypothetical protein